MMEFPCSQILPLNQRYSPSTGWRSSSRLSGLCYRLQTKSRSQSASWSRQESIQSHRSQSSRSPCTSLQSCSPCWPRCSVARDKWQFQACEGMSVFSVLSAQSFLLSCWEDAMDQTHKHTRLGLCTSSHVLPLTALPMFCKDHSSACVCCWNSGTFQNGFSFGWCCSGLTRDYVPQSDVERCTQLVWSKKTKYIYLDLHGLYWVCTGATWRPVINNKNKLGILTE